MRLQLRFSCPYRGHSAVGWLPAILVAWALASFCLTPQLGAQIPIANPPGVGQPPISGQPGSRPPIAGQPGSQPPISGQPGSRPPIAGQPGSQSPISGQPGSRPPIEGQPGSQSPISGQPGSRPPIAGQPGSRPPATQPPTAKPPSRAPTAPPAATKKDGEEPKEPPPPEQHKADTPTRDGWEIYFTYYPPMEGVADGTKTVPIILLHGYGGSGKDYSYLAVGLQKYGFAVVVPDLRGHGRSVKNQMRLRPGERDMPVTFDGPRFRGKQEFEYMYLDVEKVRAFLRKKNNAKELNLDLLVVIGADMGANLALNWAVYDWTRTEAVRDMYRVGKNVKALVLLSPERTSHGGYTAAAALRNPLIQREMPILIAVGGEDREAYGDARRIYSPIEKIREDNIPKDLKLDDPREKFRARVEFKKSFFINAPTTLQGTKLLARTLPVNKAILDFLNWEVLRTAKDHPWKERLIPGEVPTGD